MFIWLKWPQVTIVLHFIYFAHFKIYFPGSVFDLSSKPEWNFPPGKSFIGLSISAMQSSQEVVPLYVTYRVFSPSSGNNYCAIFWIENIIIFNERKLVLEPLISVKVKVKVKVTMKKFSNSFLFPQLLDGFWYC